MFKSFQGTTKLIHCRKLGFNLTRSGILRMHFNIPKHQIALDMIGCSCKMTKVFQSVLNGTTALKNGL